MQRDSTKLRDVEQLQLLPVREIISKPVNLQHVPLLKSTREALEYACQLGGVAPKEVYPLMGPKWDKTKWSRITSGERDLLGRDIPRFNRVLKNSAYLLYLNHVDGWDLDAMKRMTDDKDREIAELRQELAEHKRAMRLWAEAHKGNG